MKVNKPKLKKIALKNIKSIKNLKFDKNGLMPAVIQDAQNKDVLMVAYMNEVSLKKTMATALATYWSRSRKCLWLKGETSGHFQKVKKIFYDCDKDTLLIQVNQVGVACHTGARSCFFTRMG